MVANQKIDPTRITIEEILKLLQDAIINSLSDYKESKTNSISTKVSLQSLGLDSIQSIQLQGFLENTFSVQIPDEVLYDSDTTLTTLATCLHQNGKMLPRPIMVNSWTIQQHAIELNKRKNFKSKAIGKIPLHDHCIKSDIDTHQFPNKCGLVEAPMSLFEELEFIFIALFVLGVFIWLPLLITVASYFISWKYILSTVVIGWSFTYLYPSDHWPPAYRFSSYSTCYAKYFSYKVIVEEPSTQQDQDTISKIYAFSPHGVFAIPISYQTLVHEFIVGENFHLLSATAVFYVPIYNMVCKAMSFRDITKSSFLSTLKMGRNVALVPGGIAEMFVAGNKDETLVLRKRKGFVKIAIQTGSPIVPCYTFGHTQMFKTGNFKSLEAISRYLRLSIIPFYGRWGLPLPFKTPLVTVIGRKIDIPKDENPSDELVNKYHEQYLQEISRIYHTYKNVYNWEDRKLIIV